MRRREFIAALFAGMVATEILESAKLEFTPPPVPISPQWLQHYSYLFSAEMRGEFEYRLSLAVRKPFLMRAVQWHAPEGAICGIYDGESLLATCTIPPGLSGWPLAQQVFISADSPLSVRLRNVPGNFGPHVVSICLSGVQEITEEEARSSQTIDAEFEEEDEKEGPE